VERRQLRDGDGVVGQDLEQERLELVVGPVDLVDEEDGRRVPPVVDGPQERPADEEPLGVQLVLEILLGDTPTPGSGPGRLDGPQVEELAGVVPLVDGLGGVDALVALQAQELAARPAGEDLGDLGLADAGLALEEQRPAQAQREEDGRGEALVRQVLVAGEGLADLFDVLNVLGVQDFSLPPPPGLSARAPGPGVDGSRERR
jgi:hypothetical protein